MEKKVIEQSTLTAMNNLSKTKVTKEIIDKIYVEAKKYNCNIFIPNDCSVSSEFKGSGKNNSSDSKKSNAKFPQKK